MADKGVVQRGIRALILSNPSASVRDIVNQTGASVRTVRYVISKLRKEGLLPPARRANPAPEVIIQPSNSIEVKEIEVKSMEMTPELLKTMAFSDSLPDSIESEEETRKKMIIEVQKFAFAPNVNPETRMNAIQVWVKLKDIVRGKELGPGNPLTEEAAIERLVRIMQACGPTLVIKALDKAFERKISNAEETNRQENSSEGTSETSSTS